MNYTFLLAVKRNSEEKLPHKQITRVCIVTAARNKVVDFVTDEKLTASQKAAKWFLNQDPIRGCDHMTKPKNLLILGLNTTEDLKRLWLDSMTPDDKGCYPYMLPMWFPTAGTQLDVLFFRDTPWPEFIRSRGLFSQPEWTGPGDDTFFDVQIATSLALQLRILDSSIKVEAKVEMQPEPVAAEPVAEAKVEKADANKS